MSLFSYKAIDSKGRNQVGTLDAANEGDLELRLSRMGMDLIKCKFVEEKRSLFAVSYTHLTLPTIYSV